MTKTTKRPAAKKRKPVNKGGRPFYKPNDKERAMVKAMAGYGATQDDIAAVLGCHDDTLRRHFADELKLGSIEANTAMIQALHTNGVKHNNVAAQIFWAKTRCGFREVTTLANAEGESFRTETTYRWANEPQQSDTITAGPDVGEGADAVA